MNLLDKKNISIDVAMERKRQIDEGITLAKKVDALRETLSSLENQHRIFIEKVKTELQEATQELDRVIAVKKAEIKDLENRKQLFIEDVQREAMEEIAKKTAELVELKDILDKRIIKADERLKKADEIYSRLKIREREFIRFIEKK